MTVVLFPFSLPCCVCLLRDPSSTRSARPSRPRHLAPLHGHRSPRQRLLHALARLQAPSRRPRRSDVVPRRGLSLRIESRIFIVDEHFSFQYARLVTQVMDGFVMVLAVIPKPRAKRDVEGEARDIPT